MTWSFDLMRYSDRDYVFDSWKRSYRESPRGLDLLRLGEDVYGDHMQATIERLLERGEVRIARPDGWAEGILAWVCTEQQPDVFAVHYGFAKRRARKRATGESLFWALISMAEPRGELVFTHLRPPYTATLTDHGYTFAPEYLRRQEAR